MQLTALINVPDDWQKEDVATVIQAGLTAEVVRRWRKSHGKQEYPTPSALLQCEVLRIKYPNPKPEELVQTTEKQPKLDRKTRGQVRRVTNKLRTIERRSFPSSSNPSKLYEAVVYADGQVLCNCQGWTMKKKNQPRQCRHTAELIGDRDVIDNGEYQFIASLVSKSPAPYSDRSE